MPKIKSFDPKTGKWNETEVSDKGFVQFQETDPNLLALDHEDVLIHKVNLVDAGAYQYQPPIHMIGGQVYRHPHDIKYSQYEVGITLAIKVGGLAAIYNQIKSFYAGQERFKLKLPMSVVPLPNCWWIMKQAEHDMHEGPWRVLYIGLYQVSQVDPND